MSLIPRDPFDALVPLREAMNRLIEDGFVGPTRFEAITGRTFLVDLYETEDRQQYVLEAALPGFKLEDLHITAMDDTITIHVARKAAEKDEKSSYVRRERFEGKMTRAFTLPTTIEPDKIEAHYEHGILRLSIPKAEQVKPKPITVRA
ncbi:MAG TPA: Hsp20/alpha crystallin family protein [Ktedonosporobacter sp.]|jgi:HSP20 family protein|nr:Hsp20/alpha crystallin family protein [Ktedonosporobacter sp.]